MSRRWIRIDQAHRTFDCSDSEFDTLLNEAESKSASVEVDSKENSNKRVSDTRNELGELELTEAVNAELAQLAALQRRDRFIQKERDQSKQEIEQTSQGQLLAELHAAKLRHV